MAERVLIIDDEKNIRQMVRLTLEAAGYEVGEAEDGIEAFAILGGDPSWNVILLDQRMPLMEGTEVLRRLKVLAPSTRVVMMTAFASVEIAVEAMKLGATDFLRKPMTPEVLRNSVGAAITRKSEPELYNNSATESPITDVVTMNGFSISRALVPRDLRRTNERRFQVRKPGGEKQEIVVEISVEAIENAERLIPGRPMEDAFWTEQAEAFLSDFIWNDGNIPGTGRLVLKEADQDALHKLAREWRKDEKKNFSH